MHTPFALPELTFDPAVLAPVLDPYTVEIHHSRHHAAYVRGANEAFEKLKSARMASDYGNLLKLEKDFAFHHGGHVLHSLMWRHLGAPHEHRTVGSLQDQISKDFGNFETFVSELSISASLVQGSGWVLACWDYVGNHIMIQPIQNHEMGLSSQMEPFLAIDVWEHAYYLQFQNKRSDYIDAFWNVVQWKSVSEHFAEIIAAKKIPFASAE